ncbi:acetyl-CoA decarbonylase/synthase complex subunit gamma [bacterium BMS3Abin02]|nr:acetyl-CoA decarbonylase/synthase complex subunit gamma [bacterium BMS3Abin02]HDK44925.1 4Fe-4S dicluster domain-containing protein [Actinomycetota bacterium]HDL50233.1 4Fe-4S dicluster domain-containing protein [Actinomycetota bacterium]
MSALDSVFDTALRFLPHRSKTGLFPIGDPDRSSPVVVTGNYTLTVRRVVEALQGEDVWLLVADSRGINVWCAAGGGHLTHHDVIAALRTSRIADRVDHRELVLPQLSATGVERSRVEEATGWHATWGPVHATDLPAFLRRGRHAVREERAVRFPMSDRLQMAIMWTAPMVPILWLILWPITGPLPALIDAAAITAIVLALFAGMPWLPLTTHRGLLVYSVLALAGFGFGVALFAVAGAMTTRNVIVLAAACVIGTGIVSVDVAGSTPLLSSSVNPSDFKVELLIDRCTGAAQCVLVCPRDVLVMNGHIRKVEIVRPANCILCGACIVQCPEDALRFRFDDGRVVEPATIRRTRLNLLGKRTVTVPD